MDLPSLLAFQPRFYRGGPIRHHLALLYDLVATRRPRRIVVVGFGNGEAFFTLCQAVRETGLDAECTAIWRGSRGRRSRDRSGLGGRETLRGRERMASSRSFQRTIPDGGAKNSSETKVDLLLLDQCESGSEITAELDHWSGAVSPDATILVHGIDLNRPDRAGSRLARMARRATGHGVRRRDRPGRCRFE